MCALVQSKELKCDATLMLTTRVVWRREGNNNDKPKKAYENSKMKLYAGLHAFSIRERHECEEGGDPIMEVRRNYF